MRIARLILPAALLAAAFASPLHAAGPVVVRARFEDPEAARALASSFGHARIDMKRRLLQVDTDADGIARLQAAGFEVSIDQDATERLQRSLGLFAPQLQSIPGHGCYRTVEETYASMDALAAAHPNLVSVSDIGETWLEATGGSGYPMRVVRATNSAIAGPKPVLMLVASIHAREYTPAELATRFVEQLVEGYGTDADATWILDHHEVHAVLQANPDGRKRAESGQSWRKNVNSSQCGGSGAGIDLNRNFPFEWGNWGGSSGSPCQDTYRGVAPASEPETQAIVDYVRATFPDQRPDDFSTPAPADASGVFIDLHSYSQLVLWPWGFNASLAPNGTALATMGRRLAWFNGYTAQQAVGLYPTDGTTDDFAYGERGVAAFTMELGTAFFQACGTFENTILPDNLGALRYAARVARAPFALPSGPEPDQVSAGGGLVAAGQPFTVRARFDDARFQQGLADNSGPPAPVHAIQGGAVYVGTPPWQAGAPDAGMVAEDGMEDSSDEVLVGTVAGVPAGRHLVFVQGLDSSGAQGPVAATFVEAAPVDSIAVVSGTVSSRMDAAPLAATVSAGTLVSYTNPADGAYVRALPPGSHDLVVAAPHHEPAVLEGFSALPGGSAVHDFALYALCPLLDEPVDAGAPTAFTAGGTWARRASAGQDGGGAWATSATGNYGNSLNMALTSAPMDLTGWSSPALGFASRCDTESGWDFGFVEVSTNGVQWQEVYSCSGQPQWRQVYLELPQLAGAAAARIRFRFTSDGNTTAPGWFLDDILLESTSQECRDQQAPPEVAITGFGVAPDQVLRGQVVVLAWQTEFADACSLDDGSGPVALGANELGTGSRALVPQQDTSWILSCSGNGGPVQASTSVTVIEPLAITGFSATPSTIVAGEAATLAWSTVAAEGCSIGDDHGGVPIPVASEALASGTLPVAPLVDTVYTLACDGPGGPLEASAAVLVQQPVAVLAFFALPSQVDAGEPVTLFWQTEHASACTLSDDHGHSGPLPPEALEAGALEMHPLEDTQWTLSCDGPGGPALQAVGATVRPAAPLPDPLFDDGFE